MASPSKHEALEALGQYLEWCVSPIQDSRFTNTLRQWAETLLDGASGIDDDPAPAVDPTKSPDDEVASFVSASLQVSVADKTNGIFNYTSAEGLFEANLANSLTPANVASTTSGTTASDVVVARAAVVSWMLSRCGLVAESEMTQALRDEMVALKSTPAPASGLLHSFLMAVIFKNPQTITSSSYSKAVGDDQIIEINKIQPTTGGTAPSPEDAAKSNLCTYIADQMEHLVDTQITADISNWTRGLLNNSQCLGVAGSGVNAIQQNKSATNVVVSFVSALMNAPATTGAGGLFLYSAAEGAAERTEAEKLVPTTSLSMPTPPVETTAGPITRAVLVSWIANRIEALGSGDMSSLLISEINALTKGAAAKPLTHSFVIALMTKNPMNITTSSYNATVGQAQINLIEALNTTIPAGSGSGQPA